MHIKVESISLARLEFEVHPEHITKEISINLAISCRSEYPEENTLVQFVDFDIAHKTEEPAITLKFTFASVFRSEGDGSPTLDEFAKIHAPAYVIPYARELIANLTSRVGLLPTLLLPPINVQQLLEQAKQPERVCGGDDNLINK
jgi:preprotein translocase subunit SecB